MKELFKELSDLHDSIYAAETELGFDSLVTVCLKDSFRVAFKKYKDKCREERKMRGVSYG